MCICECVRGQRQLSCRSVAVGGKTWLSFELPAVRGELSWAELPCQFSTGHPQHARAPNQHHQPASPPAPHLACRNTKTKTKALSIFICILANSTLNSFMHFALVKSDSHSPLSPRCCFCCCFSERVLLVCAYKIWMQCVSVGGHCQRDVLLHTHIMHSIYTCVVELGMWVCVRVWVCYHLSPALSPSD